MLLCCAVVVSVTGCGQPRTVRPQLKVVATLAPLADWARQVGQERVSVTQLVPSNVDPYTYTPSPRDLQALAEADVLLYNGLGLEPWLEQSVPEAKVRQLVMLDLAKFVGNAAAGRTTPLRQYSEQSSGVRESRSGRELVFSESIVTSPYLWLDPGPNMAQFAVQLIADTFTRADPDHLLTFRRNAERYNGELEVLDGWIRREVRSWPQVPIGTRRGLVMQVPDRAWYYFAQRYGITLRPYADSDGIGKRPVPELPIFGDQFVDPAIQFNALGLRQPDGMLKPLGEESYIQIIRTNVATIARGMQRAARQNVLPARRMYEGL